MRNDSAAAAAVPVRGRISSRRKLCRLRNRLLLLEPGDLAIRVPPNPQADLQRCLSNIERRVRQRHTLGRDGDLLCYHQRSMLKDSGADSRSDSAPHAGADSNAHPGPHAGAD